MNDRGANHRGGKWPRDPCRRKKPPKKIAIPRRSVIERLEVSAVQTCPRCGGQISENVLEGLCPECLRRSMTAIVPLDVGKTDAFVEGELFGDYEILEEIGRGAMGVIFKARQLSLNRTVALKMIRADRLAKEEDIARFQTEAQAAASLQHPGIVAIHEIGDVEGQHFYSMDFVPGQSLEELAREKSLPAKKAAYYVQAIAEAIDYAHSKGILHRDLKPSNVLIDEDDQPLVTDFGLAKVMSEDSQLTMSGSLVGTPSYMSPEQARGRIHEVSVASDVYSLGAILYELLTGRVPFQAESMAEVLRQVIEDEPVSPRVLKPNLPRDLETICLKCLEKAPGKRYGTAQELAAELARFLENEPIQARPISRPERVLRWCRRKPWVTAVIVVGIAGLIGILVEWRRAEIEKRENLQRLARLHRSNGIQHMEQGDLLGALPSLVEALRLEEGDAVAEAVARLRIGSLLQQAPKLEWLWFHDELVTCAAFSSDGESVATGSIDGKGRIFSVATGERIAPILEHNSPVLFVEFSPDGSRLVFTYVDQTAQVCNAKTGERIGPPLRHKPSGKDAMIHAAFSRDTRLVLTGGADTMACLWSAERGEEVIPPISHGAAITYVAFHPSGEYFAVACQNGDVWIRDVRTGKEIVPPLKHNRGVAQVRFSPDGFRLMTVCGDNTTRIWNPKTGQRIGSDLLNSAIASEVNNPAQNTAAFSPDSHLVATTGTDRTARIWDVETGLAVGPPLRQSHSIVQISFSPDSRYVITTSHDHSARIWDVATGDLVASLPHNGQVLYSAFSPDGHHVLTAGQDKIAKLWDIAAARSFLPPLEHNTNAVNDLAFSPDGNWIATAGGDRAGAIWDAHTGKQLALLRHTSSVASIQFGLDGRQVVTASRDGTAGIWEVPSGKRLQRLPHSSPVTCATFSPNRDLVLTGCADGSAYIWNPVSETIVWPLMLHTAGIKWVAFTPDGLKAVTASSDNTAQIWDVTLGKPIGPRLHHDAELRHAVFSPDSTKLLTVCADAVDPYFYPARAGQIWEVKTGKRLKDPLWHTDGVLFGAFSPDGEYAATASEDGTVRVWYVRSGKLALQPLKHDYHVFSVEFSPDSRYLLSAGKDGTARLWDVRTGEPVIPVVRALGVQVRATLSPDGQSFGTRTETGKAQLWVLSREERSLQELTQLAQILTGNRLDPLSGPTPLDIQTLHNIWDRWQKKYHESREASSRRVLAWHRLEADRCMAQNLWRAAIFHLDRVLQQDSASGMFLLRRAKAHFALNEGSDALEDVTRATKLEAPLIVALPLTAQIHENTGSTNAAIEDLTAAVSSAWAPHQKAPFLIERARLYNAFGNRDMAITDLNEALQLNSGVSLPAWAKAYMSKP